MSEHEPPDLSLSKSPDSPSSDRPSLEASLSRVSLDSLPETGAHAGPSRSARQSPILPPVGLEFEDNEGDIGVSTTSPTRDSSPVFDGYRGRSLEESELDHDLSGSRTRTPSPSRSPRQRTLTPLHGRGISPIETATSPIRALSPPSPAPPSRQSFSSIGSSQSFGPPPQPRFEGVKPSVPNGIGIVSGDLDAVDQSAPFESISLNSTTPPPVYAGIPLPSSPRVSIQDPSHRRISWGSVSRKKDGDVNARERVSEDHQYSSNGEARSAGASASAHDLQAQNANGTASSSGTQPGTGTSTPRLHAPPARPFPFPIPSSSNPASPPPSHRVSSSSASPAAGTSVLRAEVEPTAPQMQPQGLGVKGRSTFEKVISHTRPSWLPPKDRHEDEVHLQQWEEMMAQSREHEKQMQKAAEARRAERQKAMSANMPLWDELLSDKDFSSAKVRSNEKLRQLWFEGVPSHLRGKAWSLVIGNPLAVSKDAYKSYVTRSRKAIQAGRFPQPTLDRIEMDLDDTLPHLRMFHRGSPLRDDLRELITAWVVCRSDEGLGYASYVNLLAAMLILVSPPNEAFISLINLLSRSCPRAFYTETTDEIDGYYRVLENLQADAFPKIYANCKNLGLRVPQSWFRGMLVEQVPFDCACRLWDQIMLDGDGYIFRAALAIFGFLEPRLYYPDHDEILSVLEGHNPATMAITARERERARLRGEAFLDAVDGKLSVFGLNEGVLFGWLAEDGWKEKGFERLVLREMPD
ncbi:hypothetical protein IAU60_005013 [Kwoniella sp. DSM 27419]